MSEFKRGITNQNFITELNGNKYWQQIAKDDDLFIAIHKEVIHVYYYGQRVCEVGFLKSRNKIKWVTHEKYLGFSGTKYLDMEPYLEKIEEIKLAAKEKCGKEKEQVKMNILADKSLCILDVEITFGKEEGYEKRSIDYLAIEKEKDEKIKLVFYEAKHFDNSEIRANAIPKVFKQMRKYEDALNNHREEILNSYKKIYENIQELNLNNKNKLVQIIGANYDDIKIDSKPRLIIFAVGKDDQHLTKLKMEFGEKRLILKERIVNG
jgi:hypothetical protein